MDSKSRPGEQNGMARLTAQKVREIRASPLNRYALAKRYAVSYGTIRDVREGYTWGHVQDEEPHVP